MIFKRLFEAMEMAKFTKLSALMSRQFKLLPGLKEFFSYRERKGKEEDLKIGRWK